MHSLRDSEDDFAESNEGRDREISLGTPTILGIFFAIALICALFFGFGYTLGRHSAQLAGTPATQAPESAASTLTGAIKPAPGSPALRPGAATPANDSPDFGAESQESTAAGPAPGRPTQDRPRSVVVPAAASQLPTSPLPAKQPATLATAGAPTIVQVTALTRQDDADNLVAALKKRGYDVVIRHEPQDKLLHVQIGPLASKKDAEAVRQRLLADGYHAILKDPTAASPQAAPRQ